MIKVAIQGIEGCFHHEAANKQFKDEFMFEPCMSFYELAVKVADGSVDYGVMAIENSIAGSILPNFNLILKNKLKIIGEQYLRIQQNLMGLPGVAMEDVKQVFSHPMALYQCEEFLHRFDVKLIEKDDTALSAKIISDEKLTDTFAVAGELAAEIYGLDIIHRNIQTIKDNYTRFFILSKEAVDNPAANKSSICFSLPNKPGALADVLNEIKRFEINMTKLQSHPIVGKTWEYNFYVDLVYSNETQYKELINAISKQVLSLDELGRYEGQT
jgi:prephenate dehydratase